MVLSLPWRRASSPWETAHLYFILTIQGHGSGIILNISLTYHQPSIHPTSSDYLTLSSLWGTSISLLIRLQDCLGPTPANRSIQSYGHCDVFRDGHSTQAKSIKPVKTSPGTFCCCFLFYIFFILSSGTFVGVTGKEAHRCLWTWSCEGTYLHEERAYLIKQSGEISDSDIILTPGSSCTWSHIVYCMWFAETDSEILLTLSHSSKPHRSEDSIFSLMLLAEWKRRTINFFTPEFD